MTGRILVAALALVVVPWGPASLHRTVSAQASPSDRMAIVAIDSPLHLQVWRAGAAGFEKAWEATPRVADPATWDKRRSDALASSRDSGMQIADIDGDGSNDLVVADLYGLTVYGRSPAYYSFPTAEGTAPSFAAADADGDAAAEIITQRTLTPSAAETDVQREIEVLKPAAGTLTSTWKQRLPGAASAVLVDDVDNDREQEILAVGSDAITILKRRPGPKWEVVAELPTGGSVGGAVRIADVDSDGKKEIVTGGRNGKVTIYRYSKAGQRVTYPVMWQSANLMGEGMKAGSSGAPPFCSITSLAIADVDADKQAEIVAGTSEGGRIGEKDIRAGRLHVFRFDGRGDFASVWVSDWISPGAGVAGAADVDGDGAIEIVVNGRNVYKRDSAADTFRSVAALSPTATSAVVGALPDLREPSSATRILPLYWTVPNRQVAEGETVDVTLTLRNVWSEARDVTVAVTPVDSAVQVSNATFKFPSIPANSTVTTPAFKLTGREAGKLAYVRFEVTAANGFKQSSTAYAIVSVPIPTYMADVESRLAGALARAREDNKRVLVQWGSNGDAAAASLITTMRKDSTIGRTILYEYEIVRAESKSAERVAAKYKGPGARPAPPYFTVLDAQGKVLASQAAAAFKTTGGGTPAYDVKKLNEFLTKYKPAYVNAEPLLTEALSRAKKEQKTLFLWFSAPW